MGKLDGKLALVTGAGAGIGRAIAHKLAEEGATIIVTDVNESVLQETLDSVQRVSRDCTSHPIDVTLQDSVHACAEWVRSRYGAVDILVSNAGVSTMGRFFELSEEEWDFNVDVNLKGLWRVTKEFVPPMIEQRSGRVIVVASMAAKLGAPYLAHYSASKFGVVGYVQAIAREVAKHGITVNSVCPGFVQTEMQNREIVWEAQLRGIDDPEEIRAEYVSLTPLGRLCRPEDVANVVSFLAAEESSFMTGQALNVTGGICVH